MTPQEQRNKRWDELRLEQATHCEHCEQMIKTFLTSEVNLTIEQVEKWAEGKRLPEINDTTEIINEIIDDLLTFLKELKK